MVQLYLLMGGWAMFGGLAVVIVATVVNAWLGLLQQKLQKQILAYKGTRVKILNEIISGIKVDSALIYCSFFCWGPGLKFNKKQLSTMPDLLYVS